MPLTGKTIVVTRGEKGSQEWIAALTERGAKVVSLPTITMAPLEPNQDIRAALQRLEKFDWIVFTSTTGVRYFLSLYKEIMGDITHKTLPHIATVGPRTSAEAEGSGITVTFEPSGSTSEQLAKEIPIDDGQHILLMRTTIASDDLPQALKKRGALVTDLRIYQTSPLTQPDESFSQLLHSGTLDYITFASPSAVEGLMTRLNAKDIKQAKQVPVVAIGPSVARALTQAGFAHVHTASSPSLAGIIDILQKLAR